MEVARRGCARADAGIAAAEILRLPAIAAIRGLRQACGAAASLAPLADAFDAQCAALAPAQGAAR
jgi:hypothetical protein